MRAICTLAAMMLLTAVPFSRGAAQAADTSEASLLKAREAVWRDFYANAPTLATALPANFIAMGAGDSTWQDKATILAASRASAAEGVTLVSLRFPRNKIERYGPVAVIYSRYETVVEGPKGRTTRRGNVTEIFRWDGKQWLHPSWHLDNEG